MRIHRSLRFSVVTLAALGVIAALVVALDSLWIQHRLGARATEAFVAKDVVADILPPPMYLIELRLVLSQAIEGTLDPAAARRDFDRLVGEYGQRVKYWTEHPPYGLERKLLGRQHEAAQRFIDAARTNVMTKVAAADLAGAREALAGIHALYAQHRAGVDETVSAGNAFADRSLSALDTTQSESRWTLLAVTAVTLGVIVVAGRFVLSCVESPVERCTASARRIAAGDLTPGEAVDPRRQDAVGRLEQALAQMREQFARMVNDVRLGAEAVASSSVQIAHGNADLSARTERQASALQQTASSMTELDSSARLNAENARQASSLAGSASGTAEHGGEVIAQVVATIRGINESSRRIADIIGTIDAIAFQTNILALNAAVEAARAGDQGRGFAVVAEEVRALAHRSAHAAKEIKTLISGSVERVEQGTTLVEQSLATMEQVVSAIRRATALISEISSASAEQSSGVAQIGQAITQMDQDTQHNAALVEQSAAAAQSLKSQAEQLLQAASRFKLSVAAITSDAPGLRA